MIRRFDDCYVFHLLFFAFVADFLCVIPGGTLFVRFVFSLWLICDHWLILDHRIDTLLFPLFDFLFPLPGYLFQAFVRLCQGAAMQHAKDGFGYG